jgi:hypothetical protein
MEPNNVAELFVTLLSPSVVTVANEFATGVVNVTVSPVSVPSVFEAQATKEYVVPAVRELSAKEKLFVSVPETG